MTHDTYCDFHLGDNLVHLHFLRRQAVRNPQHVFRHYVHDCHLEQLREAIEDLPNICLYSLTVKPEEAINVWKNAGAGTSGGGFFEGHSLRYDFVQFHLEWFRHLARQMDLLPVFHCASDLLFDYPALQKDIGKRLPERARENPPQILFINSRPCSGQAIAYDDVNYFDPLIERLSKLHKLIVTQPSGIPDIPCTTQTEMSISEIGALSLRCQYLMGVATGPMWPTFNIWNQQSIRRRFIMLGNGERLNLGTNIQQVGSREEMCDALAKDCML